MMILEITDIIIHMVKKNIMVIKIIDFFLKFSVIFIIYNKLYFKII